MRTVSSMRRKLYAITLLVAAVVLTRCGAPEQRLSSLTVFAAASTTDVMEFAAERFEEETGTKVSVNLAASSMLANQIAAGSNADLFLSASVQWVDYLEERDLVESRQNLLENRLVIVVPNDSTAEIDAVDDLLSDEVKRVAIAEPGSVPAGIYAKAALTALGFWDQIEPKLIPGDDVRQTLIYVERGEADAGFVYATDAAITDAVRVAVTVDPQSTGPIEYPLALLRGAPEPEAARAFLEFLLSPEMRAEFERQGFVMAQRPSTP